jgi:hypothetical protein
MDSLSIDLLREIFQKLDAVMLCRLSEVSKDFRVAADDDSVWDTAHGFTKGRSFVTLMELGALSLSKTEECNAAAHIASISEFDGSTEDESDDAIARRNRAYEAWDAAHGFTKQRSSEILFELGILSLSKSEEVIACSCAHLNSEFDGSTEDESDDAIGRRDRANAAWETAQNEQRIIRRMHAIAYRMLRVPKKLRVVAADALVHYYKVTQCIDSILKGTPRCSDDDIFAAAYRDLNRKRLEAEQALIAADADVMKWEHSFVDRRRWASFTPAFCCTQKPWGSSPSLENLEHRWMFE